MHQPIKLTKERLEAIIDALTEALAGEPPGKREVYQGALDWASQHYVRTYNIKENSDG